MVSNPVIDFSRVVLQRKIVITDDTPTMVTCMKVQSPLPLTLVFFCFWMFRPLHSIPSVLRGPSERFIN